MKMDESLEAIHRWRTVCRTIKPMWPPFHPMLRPTYQTPQKSSKPEQISPAVFQASLGGGLLHLALVQTAWHHEQSIRPQKTSPEELTRFGKRSFRLALAELFICRTQKMSSDAENTLSQRWSFKRLAGFQEEMCY